MKDRTRVVPMPVISVAGINYLGEACLFVRPIFELKSFNRYGDERWMNWMVFKQWNRERVVSAVKRRLPRKMKKPTDD